MIRRVLEDKLRTLSAHFPVVTVTGPRQAGKTTLCRATFPHLGYVSLEAPDIRAYAMQDPRGFLASHRSGAILDEVQRAPDLLSYLQGEVDERPEPGRFVLTGSANFALLQSVSQSLAGRTALLQILPLGLEELRSFGPVPAEPWEVLWRGSYPAIFDRGIEPGDWYGSYVGTYLERDVRQILNVGDLLAFQSFLRLTAG
jgi:predicted AAA+ superfamily ATPase